MKRRDFIRTTVPAAILPTMINGFSIKAFGSESPLARLLGGTTNTDHVLVIVQLSGGNDGLNTVIPIDNYSNYFNARSNIAIPEASILKLTDKTGLNPAMTGFKSMYDNGKLAVIQSAGYPTPNFSHFRATDIWMSASDSTEILISGWAGRYLNYEYPNFPSGYPNTDMPDPLGIQIGSTTTLTFQGPAFSEGMAISNPTSFYNLLAGVEDPAPNNNAGKELKYVRLVGKQTSQYADRVKTAALSVTQQVPYPTPNSLADQLKIVARLIKGGLKTRIYMVNYGSFDTHSNQTTVDTTVGTHAKLLGNVSDAIKAFQDDLKFQGIEDRVMGMTFSEFGRRIKSNSSVGTDHGAAAPMFVFGKNVLPGVLGNNPTLPVNATVNDNIVMQYDFRSVYATLLENWLCVKNADLQQIMLRNFQSLPIVNAAGCKPVAPSTSGNNYLEIWGTVFTQSNRIIYKTDGGHTLLQIFDTMGRLVRVPVDADLPAGSYNISFDSGALPSGVYYVRLQNGSTQQVKVMIKER